MLATEESPKMFESNFVDSFSRVPWHAVPIIFVPISVGLFYYAFAQGLAWRRWWDGPLLDSCGGRLPNTGCIARCSTGNHRPLGGRSSISSSTVYTMTGLMTECVW